MNAPATSARPTGNVYLLLRGGNTTASSTQHTVQLLLPMLTTHALVVPLPKVAATGSKCTTRAAKPSLPNSRSASKRTCGAHRAVLCEVTRFIHKSCKLAYADTGSVTQRAIAVAISV